jgi:hypothetical protein
MSEEHRAFFRLASLTELLHYQRIGGTVPREAFARAAREADEKARQADAMDAAKAYLAGQTHRDRRGHKGPRTNGADAA